MRTISSDDVISRIRLENPWWTGNQTTGELYRKLKPRPYFDLFFPLVKSRSIRRAVILMGPRRVGKTVMIHHTVQALLSEGVHPQSVCYISVDHPIYSGLSLQKLLTFYAKASGIDYKAKPVYIFFDEIQYLHRWEVHLKSLVDTYAQIKFVASG